MSRKYSVEELRARIQRLKELPTRNRRENLELEALQEALDEIESQQRRDTNHWGPMRDQGRLHPSSRARQQPLYNRGRARQVQSGRNGRQQYQQALSSFENQARQVVSSASPLFKWGVLEAVAIFFSLAFVSQIWGTLWMFVALWAVTLFFGYIFKPKSRGASSAKALAFVFAPLIGTAITFFSTSAGMSIITTGAILISGWKSLNDDRMSARVIDGQEIDDSGLPGGM